ncbi:MAG: flagellar basal body L-ring protein FlgH [Pseudomonadota bacterium]|jgi:flagellar L-ring protein FlgH|nr:flagellar basal body L-ring protein [Alphaproteobacteria bacterium]
MSPSLPLYRILIRTVLCSALISLGACSNTMNRLQSIGSPPPLTPLQGEKAGVPQATQVALPMPADQPYTTKPNSLWRTGSRAFFKDQRATKVGDILTVNINVTDSATVDNKTTRSRTAREGASANALLGYERSLGKILPEAIDPENLIDTNSSSKNEGAGSVNRKEAINTTVAAIITQILPNGNFVIQGRQEVRINFEVREIMISGVVRPEDISNQNTVQHTQIAEARISYGGRGQLTDVQQARYGQQLFDILAPF